jgi:hypothetical protein
VIQGANIERIDLMVKFEQYESLKKNKIKPQKKMDNQTMADNVRWLYCAFNHLILG